jgi:hypothetical protein
MRFKVLAVSLRIGSIFLGGCASTITPKDQYSGFLKDYSRLKEDKSSCGGGAMRWIDRSVKVSKYSNVYIEPSQVYPKPQPTAQIPLKTLQGITQYYDQSAQARIRKISAYCDRPWSFDSVWPIWWATSSSARA